MRFGGGLSCALGVTRVTCEKLWVFIYDGWMDGWNDASRTRRRRTCATRTTDADADASARRITTPRTRAHANIIHVLEYSLHMFLTHYYISALARARSRSRISRRAVRRRRALSLYASSPAPRCGFNARTTAAALGGARTTAGSPANASRGTTSGSANPRAPIMHDHITTGSRCIAR